MPLGRPDAAPQTQGAGRAPATPRHDGEKNPPSPATHTPRRQNRQARAAGAGRTLDGSADDRLPARPFQIQGPMDKLNLVISWHYRLGTTGDFVSFDCFNTGSRSAFRLLSLYRFRFNGQEVLKGLVNFCQTYRNATPNRISQRPGRPVASAAPATPYISPAACPTRPTPIGNGPCCCGNAASCCWPTP